jgi:hypothetical protein
MKLLAPAIVLLGLVSESRHFSVLACPAHSHDEHVDFAADHRGLAGKPDYFPLECGTEVPTKKQQVQAGKAVDEWKSKRGNGRDKRLLPEVNYQIPVTFHVLRQDNGDGGVPDALIDQYMDHLNNEFTGSAFSFYKKGANRVNKSAWHFCDYERYWEAGQNLRVGGIADMNVYFCDIQTGSGGWAYFPYGSTPGQYWDGIVVESNYVKYGWPADYVRRTVLPHEAG